MSGFYHQEDRDMATGIGCMILLFGFILVVAILVVALYLSTREPVVHDGSNAGANAATIEELESI